MLDSASSMPSYWGSTYTGQLHDRRHHIPNGRRHDTCVCVCVCVCVCDYGVVLWAGRGTHNLMFRDVYDIAVRWRHVSLDRW